MSKSEYAEKRSIERKPIQVRLIIGSDITMAKSVDISESGIRVITEKPLKMRMNREVEGTLQQHEAQLVWAKKSKGGMEYGFKFLYEKGRFIHE